MEGDGSRNFFSNIPSDPSSSAAGFNLFSQVSATGRAHAPQGARAAGLGGLDLNSQAGVEEFAHLADYSNLLQSEDGQDALFFPPPRAPRTLGVRTMRNGGGGGGNGGRGSVRGQQLNFGAMGSGSAAAGGHGLLVHHNQLGRLRIGLGDRWRQLAKHLTQF